MTAFKNNPNTWSRIDFQIISNGWFQLYLGRKVLLEDLSWLEKEGYEITSFTCNGFHNLMTQLKTQFCFPGYFHDSLDSLNDCVRDIEPKGMGLVLVFNGIDSIKPDVAHDILDIFVNAAKQNFIFGKRMMVLAQVNDPDFRADSIGAIEMRWNAKEWLDSNRKGD